MRIGLVSTLATPVAAVGAGSIEGLVWLLARDLAAGGHEVTVFAAPGSEVPGAEVVVTVPAVHGHAGCYGEWQLAEQVNLTRAVERSADFDVLHCHGYLWSLLLEPFARAPLVHTLHVWATADHQQLRRAWPDACVTAISRAQWSEVPEAQPDVVVPHGIDPAAFTFRPQADLAGGREGYVCFLGRFIPEKGPLQAIAAARAAGVPVVLAGPENDYFRTAVAPHVDGVRVRYAGPVGGAARDRLLGGARALVYPPQKPEPFGLVLTEAMMCGTPVVSLRVGAAPELIDAGVTGYCANDDRELGEKLLAAFSLDRARVRATAEQRFSSHRMAAQYLGLYRHITSRAGARRGLS